MALGVVYLQFERNWSNAADALAKARALDPNNAETLGLYGHLSVAAARPDQAVEYFKQAIQGDPLNLVYRKYLGRALNYAGRPAESAVELRRAIALDERFSGLHYELGRALLGADDATSASVAFQAEPDAGWRLCGLPLGYQANCDTVRAQAALTDLVSQSVGGEYQVAETYAFFGDSDRAFEWLEKALVNDPGVVWSRNDALLASIANDPRFAAYLRRLGMPPALVGT